MSDPETIAFFLFLIFFILFFSPLLSGDFLDHRCIFFLLIRLCFPLLLGGSVLTGEACPLSYSICSLYFLFSSLSHHAAKRSDNI